MRVAHATVIPLVLGLLVLSVSPVAADDEVVLAVDTGVNPGEIRLDWTGGGPGFTVYRSGTAPYVAVPANALGTTQSRTWLDTPPAGDLFFYRVVGPCLSPSPEMCDGVDDDCDAVVDNGCGPCQSDADCYAFDQPATCNDASTCQGSRQEGVCDVSQLCVPALVDDDSACAGLPSSDCGPYPGIACTADLDQPADQASLCSSSCAADAECDTTGHCDETQNVCLQDFPQGFGCLASSDCSSDFCVDGVCCSSSCTGTCFACDVAGNDGTCTPVPDGQDPDFECGSLSCVGYYWGFSGDTCYRKADVSSSQATCGGDGACRSTVEECTAQATQGSATLTCDSLCQDPAPGTCTGTTAGSCTNVNPGTQTCGLGACQVTTQRCSNGAPVTCTPGTPTTETCNNIDDNCDGTVDNGSFGDGWEANDSCAAFKTLPTVGSDQTLTQNTLTIYPSGDTDYFRINATETDGTCACCDFFCTDEDYTLRITLTVPTGAGSYQLCTATDCASVATNCVNIPAGGSNSISYFLDGACGAGNDSYTVYVRISPGNAPGYECAPYTLSYFFDALVCH